MKDDLLDEVGDLIAATIRNGEPESERVLRRGRVGDLVQAIRADLFGDQRALRIRLVDGRELFPAQIKDL